MVAEYQGIADSSYKVRLVVNRLNTNGAVIAIMDLGLVLANFGPRRESMLALPDKRANKDSF